ncbi:unnamed protein product [Lepeophtheirus salmonis]|uniref:(salmon louse) hypothetical protein n=1 Tax=Lepeophtheirus salmonis TaxID=72036 RepID=A0A7R8D089_LEPSM|nr:unnamed protein product [Lepeophtheirus salmonis]CAF2981888.1 unnamed protein product [Lepeophtheirus salmonis]
MLIFDDKDEDEDYSDSVSSSKKNASHYKLIEKWYVFCNNLPNFIKYIIENRECKKPCLKLGQKHPGSVDLSPTHFLGCDFKFIDILLGLQNHVATYPCCCWFEAKKPSTDEKHPMRTLGNIKENYNERVANKT